MYNRSTTHQIKILPQNRNVQQLECVHLDEHLARRETSRAGGGTMLGRTAKYDLLAQQRKVWLVRDEREHNEIGIEAVKAVTQIRIIVGLHLHVANIGHDLVLALTGYL